MTLPILPGTFEHAIDYIVENRINTSSLEARYRNDKTGASAYSPKILLKIILFAYSRGIVSSRKIEHACLENVVFMALTGGQAPDFTTIAGFVRSLKDEINNIFRDVLLICEELNLLGGTEFAIDGCKMSSNASKEWSGTFSDLKKKKEKIESNVKHLLKKHRRADGGDSAGEDSERLKKQIERIEKKANKIENFLRENEPKPNSRKGERQSNITDNESAKMKTSHGVIQGYNGMAINDSKKQVIIAAEAFGSGQEQDLLKPMIEGAKENMEAVGLGQGYLKEKTLIADTGSFCENNLKYLSEEEIDAYIPDQQFRKRDPRFEERDRFRPDRNIRYTKENFIYREDTNDFVCPEGNILEFKLNQTFGNTSGRVYKAKQAECRKCSQRVKCVNSDKTRHRSLYVIENFFNRNFSEEMKSKIDTPEGREIYSRRMGIIEPVFGNIKNAKGLDGFTLRSKAKVNVQWVLYCMVHNIEKILKYGEYEQVAVSQT